jgi:hypothetical protein
MKFIPDIEVLLLDRMGVIRRNSAARSLRRLTGLCPQFARVKVSINFKECQYGVISLGGQANAGRCHDHIPGLERVVIRPG